MIAMSPVLLMLMMSNLFLGHEMTTFVKVIWPSLVSTGGETVVVDDILVCARRCADSNICRSFAFSTLGNVCYIFNGFVASVEGSTQISGTSAYWKYYSCPPQYLHVAGTGSCLRVVLQRVSHAQAMSDCLNDGTGLLTLKTPEKISLIRDYLSNYEITILNYWLGGAEVEGVWRWPDGSLMENITWCPNEPNNEGGVEGLLEIKESFTCLNDQDSGVVNSYICEL